MKPSDIAGLENYLDDRPAEGVARVDRSIFTDPDLFELEMTQIWEKTWLFIGHVDQIRNANDYFTTYMGRQPVVVVRGADGDEINVFINACSHRGVQLVRESTGNRGDFTCFFHGWCYNTSGDLMNVTKESIGGYPEQFDKADYSLTKVPKLEVYRGFIFASLNADAPPLKEHLADAAVMIDLLADQSDDGFEVLKGVSTYTYEGNWKLQTENGVDGYHVHQAHLNFAMTTANREKLRAGQEHTKSMEVGQLGAKGLNGGFFDFGNGHTMLWGDWPNKGDRRPNFHQWAEWAEKYGETRTEWMIGKLRNLQLYPNVFIMDQMSTQIRVFRPVAVNLTEVTVYCIAPKGEEAQYRRARVRQYEDFFNASGMATPDDLAEFSYSQSGYMGTLARWNDMSRGAQYLTNGSNEFAQELDINTVTSGGRVEDEGIFIAQHKRWLELMQADQSGD